MTHELNLEREQRAVQGQEDGLHLNASAFRQKHKLLELGSPEYLEARKVWVSQERQVVLVVGAGKAGEAVADELMELGIHPVVVSRDPLHGGMAVGAINSSLHLSTKLATLRQGTSKLSDPRCDVIFNKGLEPDKVHDFANDLGVSGIVWCAGAEPKRMQGINYEIRGVHDVLTFLLPHNHALDYGDKGLFKVAKEMGYRLDENGVPLPTIAQVGGKSGEDIVVADKTYRILFALREKGYPIEALNAFDAKEFFRRASAKNSSFEIELGRIGLSVRDVGETALFYHGDINKMNLFPPSSKKIDSEIKKRRDANPGKPVDEEKIMEELKAEGLAKVPTEVLRWQRVYGVMFISDGRVNAIEDLGSSLAIAIDTLRNKNEVVGNQILHGGLFVSSAGFVQPKLPSGAIPIVAAGMASGTGALPDSIYTAKTAVREILDKIKAKCDVQIPYQRVLENIARLKKETLDSQSEGNGAIPSEDVVERLFTIGPKNLLPNLLNNSRGDS